jgi:hypothetical protein
MVCDFTTRTPARISITSYRYRPCVCCCCGTPYPSWEAAKQNHQICFYWSCSFLSSANSAFYGYQDGIISCCFCDDLDNDHRIEAWHSPDARMEHLVRHNFRACDQRKYTSFYTFLDHLYEAHTLQRDPDSIGIMELRSACLRSCPSTFKPYNGPLPTSHALPTRPAVGQGATAPGHRRSKSRGLSWVMEGISGALPWNTRS